MSDAWGFAAMNVADVEGCWRRLGGVSASLGEHVTPTDGRINEWMLAIVL